jgi:hypothetical protein
MSNEKTNDGNVTVNPTPDSKTEVIKILVNDWQWRHQHCWKSLQRFGLAAITVAAIPYAKAELFQGNIATLFFL